MFTYNTVHRKGFYDEMYINDHCFYTSNDLKSIEAPCVTEKTDRLTNTTPKNFQHITKK